jgi:hypothetical protein
MLKHSETILNSTISRQDSTWDYRWDYYNPDDPQTVYLDPNIQFSESVAGDSWRFAGDAEKAPLPDPFTWDPENPFIQYEVEDSESGEGPDIATDLWDEKYIDNPTRYLRPGNGNYIKISNTLKNVVINPVPPKFVTDYGTEYLSLEATFEHGIKNSSRTKIFSQATRTIDLTFKDDVGLDYKQFALYVSNEEIDWGNMPDKIPYNVLYYYDRTLEKAMKQDYVENIIIQGNTDGTYRIQAKLYEKWAKYDKGTISDEHDIKEILNIKSEPIQVKVNGNIIKKDKYTESDLTLIVWDLAGNYSLYHIKRPFNTLSLDDLNNLVPVNILFTDVEPSNYYLQDDITNRIVTKIQNTNECLFEYENVAQLTEKSVGLIDERTYNADNNRLHSPLDGIREFLIGNIKRSGDVIVEAWVETGFAEVDAEIKDRTFNTAICGPWIYGDEGRKYNITPDTPKYLQNTEFGDFIQFFELYLNTIYTNMEGDKNISALEKIARIGNFNDIQKLENALVYQYGNEFGNEFDFNLEALQNVNLITDGSGFTARDVKDTFEIVKYVLDQLPNYNSYKGTNTGIQMAIKMFGFTCKIINIWVKTEQQVEIDPDFIEEDRLDTLNEFFMTSRFNMELNATNNLFETFVNNSDMFIKLVKSIKPLCKILNLIKYTVTLEKDLNVIYDIYTIKDEDSIEVQYDLEWNINTNSKTYKNIKNLCFMDDTTGTGDLLIFNYKPNITASEGKIPSNCFNLLGKFFKSKYKHLYIKFSGTNDSGENETITYDFIQEGILPILNNGSIVLNFTEGSNATNCYNIVKKFFNKNCNVKIYMSIIIQPGTDFAKSLKPE